MHTQKIRIAMVAGEVSGDKLSAGLVKEIKKKYPACIIEGVAGELMKKAGAVSLYDIEPLSVMGIFEVLKNIFPILKIRKGIIKYFSENKPDLYIGIDAPDFNLPIEKKLKKLGIPTVHYVSPSVWAWREGRIKTIKESTDSILSILPFEPDFYKKHNHTAHFVGHPLANQISLKVDKKKSKLIFDFLKNSNDTVIAILPGSRIQEVKKLFKIFLQAAMKISEKSNERITFIVPIAKNNLKNIIYQIGEEFKSLNLKYIDGQSSNVLLASDYAIVASGTATLETMLTKTPMIMAYKINNLSYYFVKMLMKIRMFSLPNILANKKIILELIQKDVIFQNISDEILKLINNQEYKNNMLNEFHKIHKTMIIDTNKVAFEFIDQYLTKK